MLILNVVLWPHGNSDKAEEIGHIRIINDGTASDGSGDSPIGNYIIADKLVKLGRVEGHKRADGFWPLVKRAIEVANGK